MTYLDQQPSNDNGGRPAAVPVLTCLLARTDLTHADVLVYGAVLALDGEPVGAQCVAFMLRLHRRTVIDSLRKLRAMRLVERDWRGGRGAKARFNAVGPRSDAA